MILGNLLAFLTQLPADFHDSRRNDWHWQGNKYTTFWQISVSESGLIRKSRFESRIIFGWG